MDGIDAAYCNRRCGVVCLCECVCMSVCLYVTGMNPAKTAGPIEMPFGMCARLGPSNHALDVGVGIPQGEWEILGVGKHGHALACPRSVYKGAWILRKNGHFWERE